MGPNEDGHPDDRDPMREMSWTPNVHEVNNRFKVSGGPPTLASPTVTRTTAPPLQRSQTPVPLPSSMPQQRMPMQPVSANTSVQQTNNLRPPMSNINFVPHEMGPRTASTGGGLIRQTQMQPRDFTSISRPICANNTNMFVNTNNIRAAVLRRISPTTFRPHHQPSTTHVQDNLFQDGTSYMSQSQQPSYQGSTQHPILTNFLNQDNSPPPSWNNRSSPSYLVQNQQNQQNCPLLNDQLGDISYNSQQFQDQLITPQQLQSLYQNMQHQSAHQQHPQPAYSPPRFTPQCSNQDQYNTQPMDHSYAPRPTYSQQNVRLTTNQIQPNYVNNQVPAHMQGRPRIHQPQPQLLRPRSSAGAVRTYQRRARAPLAPGQNYAIIQTTVTNDQQGITGGGVTHTQITPSTTPTGPMSVPTANTPAFPNSAQSNQILQTTPVAVSSTTKTSNDQGCQTETVEKVNRACQNIMKPTMVHRVVQVGPTMVEVECQTDPVIIVEPKTFVDRGTDPQPPSPHRVKHTPSKRKHVSSSDEDDDDDDDDDLIDNDDDEDGEIDIIDI